MARDLIEKIQNLPRNEVIAILNTNRFNSKNTKYAKNLFEVLKEGIKYENEIILKLKKNPYNKKMYSLVSPLLDQSYN